MQRGTGIFVQLPGSRYRDRVNDPDSEKWLAETSLEQCDDRLRRTKTFPTLSCYRTWLCIFRHKGAHVIGLEDSRFPMSLDSQVLARCYSRQQPNINQASRRANLFRPT